MDKEKLGCETCGWDDMCAPTSREINSKAIVERELSKCPCWKPQ